jgi:hypothetical protein
MVLQSTTGRNMKVPAAIGVMFLTLFWSSAFSEPAAEIDSSVARIEALHSEVRQLRVEIDQLKAEVEKLHHAMEQPQADSATSIASRDTAQEKKAIPVKKGYWLTTSSRTRHNSSCRYYKTTAGRPCGPKEGTPCKLCGG